MKNTSSDRTNRDSTRRRSSDSASGSNELERLASNDTLEMDDYMHPDHQAEDAGLSQSHRNKQRKDEDVNGYAGNTPVIQTTTARGMLDRKLVNAALLRDIGINVLLIGLWYSFSISISVYNKWMFSKENLDFHFPLFVTSLHMIVQFSLASAVLYFIPCFRPGADPSLNPHNPAYRQIDENAEDGGINRTDPQNPTKKAPLMTKTFYLTRIGPCGTATALDIGLGNFSLRFISLTFFTMCKSSVLLFVLLFAFLFRLESPTWRLCVIILFMTVGVVMMVAGETAFRVDGFVLVMTASLCSGFRWSLTQILLLRNPATSNSFSSIFFLTPVMFLALFALALPIEGAANVVEGIKELAQGRGGFTSFILLMFPGLLAFLMVSAEFALLKRTSVVTLSVCGIFKEVLTISAAGIVFGDELSPINVSGLVVTILSIAAYNVLKYSKAKKVAAQGQVPSIQNHTMTSREAVVKTERQMADEEVVDSTSALLRRDSEQFALAGDDDDDAHEVDMNQVSQHSHLDRSASPR